MRRKIKVTLGSESKHKIKALKEALKLVNIKAEVIGISTNSGQNNQPIGFEETLKGALTRARQAFSAKINHISVGIESGVIVCKPLDIVIDFAVVVILHQNKQIITTSPGITLPVYLSLLNKDTTVGEIITSEIGGDKTDPHKSVTKGVISRKDLLIQGIIFGLKQIREEFINETKK